MMTVWAYVAMIAIENRTNRGKQLAVAVAIFAMIACCLAVVIPAEETNAEADFSVETTEGFAAALEDARAGQIIELATGEYGNEALTNTSTYANFNGGYTIFTVDKALTIRAADGATPTIYGGFNVKTTNSGVNGVTFQGLTIILKGDGPGESTAFRQGISYYGMDVTVTGCIFDATTAGPEKISNALVMYAVHTGDVTVADYTVNGNTFIGYNGMVSEWGSSAIMVVENFTSQGLRVSTSGITTSQEAAFVSQNTFTDCLNVYDRTQWDTEDPYGNTQTNYSQDEDGNIIQNCLSVTAGTTYTISSGDTEEYYSVNVEGTLVVEGTLTVETEIIVTGNGKITVNGAGTVTAELINSMMAGIDAISTVSFNSGSAGGTVDDDETVTLYGQFATSYSAGDVFVYKTGATGTVNFTGTGNQYLYIRGNGSFDGIVNKNVGGNLISSVDVEFAGNGNEQVRTSDTSVEVKGNDGVSVDVDGVSITTQYDTVLNGITLGQGVTATIENVSIATMTLDYALTVNGGASIANGEILTFGEDGSITLGTSANLFVLGNLRTTADPTNKINNTAGVVYAMNYTEADYFVQKEDAANFVDISGGEIDINLNTTSNADALAALASAQPGMVVNISGTDKTLIITGSLELNGITINIVEGSTVTIQIGNGTATSERASVVMNNVTIDSNSTDSEVTVSRGSSLDITDSLLFIVVDALEGSTVNVDNADVVYENTSSQVSVGYGTTLRLTGNVTSVVDVYGTLVIENSANVPAGTEMTVYKGGSVVVNGTLTILGQATFEEGSSAEINGTVTVGQYSAGGAELNVNGNFEVTSTGTVTIVAVANDNVNKNVLNAPASGYTENTTTAAEGDMYYPYKFEVYGTLVMNGTMSGYVHNLGTVTINGTSDDATVVLYSDVAMTVDSVTGTLTVSDEGILDSILRTGQNVSDGNEVSLENARNVTLSVSYERYDYTSGTTNYRNYRTVMSVSGDVTTGTGMTGSIIVDGNPTAVQTDRSGNTASAYVLVAEGAELSFGVNVSLGINADMVVDGSVEFIVSTGNGVIDEKEITGNGSLTVNGTVTTSSNAVPSGISVIAVKYTITTTGSGGTVTDYYTNFADAVSAAPNADEDMITIIGAVSATEDVTIPAGVNVQIQNNGSLNVAEDVTVVLADGATMTGSSTTRIVVEGTFTAEDYAEDLGVRTIEADVMSTSGASRTWTSLANALASGMTDITLNRVVVIDEDLEIPEGVTVTSNVAPTEGEDGYSIMVDDARLTVNGILAMLENTEGAITVSGEDGEVIVNGVFYARTMTDSEPADMTNVAGAHFAIASGASTYYYVSNVAFAAQTASNNDNLDGNIVIKGIVSTGDVTFTSAEGMSMTIELQNTGGTTDEYATILTAGTVTLAGSVTLDINTNTRMTGTVTALCGDGTSNASIQLSSVRNDMTIVASSSEGATSTTYTLTVTGSYTGAMTVSGGTVTVAAGGLTVPNGSTLNVANGATLSIPAGRTMTVEDYNGILDITPVTVEGTIALANADGIDGAGEVYVSGQINASRGMNLDSNTLRVTGTLDIAADYELDISSTGVLIVGDKPTALGQTATGTINGVVSITSGVIVAYNGVDLSGAQIDINAATGESDAASTTYVINGVDYMTVYANSNNEITTGRILVSENIYYAGADTTDGIIELSGLDTDYSWYSGSDMTGNPINATPVGTYDTVYAEFDVSAVYGAISVGTGITMYIDGLTIGNFQTGYGEYGLTVGEHTVTIAADANYNIDNATITFNGQTVQNGGTITIGADDTSFTLAASGATASTPGSGDITVNVPSQDDGMSLTDILLIVLVILILVMAIIVALRLMRS